MLKAEKLSGGYGDVQVLWDIDLVVDEGQITALVGANGAGKTTLLRILSGVLPAYGGELEYKGRNIIHDSVGERAKAGIIMIPEGRQLFSGLSVQANLLMGAYTRKDKKEVKKDLEWVYTILPKLKERKDQLAGTLSGGEAQMCAIGRGLMANPKLLLIDELSLGLAPYVVDSLIELLKRICLEKNITLLLIDQDVQTALEIAEKGYVISDGRIKRAESAKSLLESAEIQKAYFGM